MERNMLVDRLRGYACFLVLFGHVIMGIRLSGIDIPHFFEGMEKFLWSFHVALFMFLSGVVYKITGEWKGKKSRWRFVLYKLFNLGVPYVAFTIIYVLLNSFAGEVNTGFSFSDILYMWKTPVAQYWFLYALFFLFCIWVVLSGILKNWQITLVVVLVGYLAPFCGLSLGSFESVFYAALVFGIGTFVNFEKLVDVPIWAKGLIVLVHVATGIVFVLLGIIEAPLIKEIMMVIGIYSSIMFISVIQSFKPLSRFLDFVSRYSFQVFLLHTIFTAGIRIVMIKMNINGWFVHVVLGTACGLAFSILAAMIAKKVKFLNFFFFPSKVAASLKSAGKHNKV